VDDARALQLEGDGDVRMDVAERAEGRDNDALAVHVFDLSRLASPK